MATRDHAIERGARLGDALEQIRKRAGLILNVACPHLNRRNAHGHTASNSPKEGEIAPPPRDEERAFYFSR
jgi:hypothetical protein